MNVSEQKKAAKEFAERWKDKGYEKGQTQQFWTDLLENVFEVSNAATFIEFEDIVHIDKAAGFIDAFIPSTKVLIEQKSIDKDLRKAIVQSDGSLLNPFQQAQRYSMTLPYDNRPRWIVTSNFKSFLIYDMNNPNGDPEEILLKNLSKEYYRLSFLTDSKNEHIKREEELSFKAGEIVGILYDAFSKQYNDLTQESSQKSLNELCVRLVFCLYAEDAGLFGRKNVFHDYLAKYNDLDLMRKALIELFKVLDQPLDKRDPYLEDDLNQFPYVNGGLFSNETIEIPKFTEEIKKTLLSKAADEFDWSEISPTIFGAVFESTLNPETRRAGGMHYTSIENIHKVIDPLFLNDLRKELNEALAYKNEKTRNRALNKFQERLGSLNFLDPACGSGNFLTETYLSLRRLENEAISAKQQGKIALDLGDVIKVHINQLYGIEINDFAVKVATTALWIAESQMLEETSRLLSKDLEFLPLKTYTNICEGNALKIDWNDVLSNTKCNYIVGNPPFIGKKYQTKEQKKDLVALFNEKKGSGNLDYVCGWYKKALDYMSSTDIETAFVSTSSIVQGEQVPLFWKPLYNDYPIKINFGYKNFRWDSEANIKAHVHCVIIGFSLGVDRNDKYLYDDGKTTKVKIIHPCLIDMLPIFIENRSKPLFDLNPLVYGSFALDDGNYTISEEEYKIITEQEPNIKKYLKLFIGSEEFINNKKRYCVWLKDSNISEIRKSSILMTKINNVQKWREKSNRQETKNAASTPMFFAEIRQPNSNYLAIPITSSEKRRYIPIGYMDKEVIASNHLLILPNATLYEFGILTSNVHMAWMRAVAGRLKSDYNYSARIVYNNFPVPSLTKEQKKKIEKTAQMILDARKKYSNNSLADLYDESTMPPELRTAHQLNNKVVMEAYGFPVKNDFTESNCVAKLMEMYQNKIDKTI